MSECPECGVYVKDDNLGNHIINQFPMLYDSIGLDYELNAIRDNFTRNGAYSYLIVCNASAVGGFVPLVLW